MRVARPWAWLVFVLTVACRSLSNEGSSEVLDDEADEEVAIDPACADGLKWAELKNKELFAASAPLFADTIHEMHIYIKKDTFKKVVTHESEGGDACKDGARYGRISRLEFTNKDNNETVRLCDIGLRVKGNTSCANFKKQFKLRFKDPDEVVENADDQEVYRLPRMFEDNGTPVLFDAEQKKRLAEQSFFGLPSVALRASQNDPTFLREKLASEVFAYGEQLSRQQDLPGAAGRGGAVYRVGFVRVHMHIDGGDDYTEIYNLAEEVNKTLIYSRWGKKELEHFFQLDLGAGNLVPLPDGPASSDPLVEHKELLRAYEPGRVGGKSVPDRLELTVHKTARAQNLISQSEYDKKVGRIGTYAAMVRAFIAKIAQVETREDLAALIDVDNFLNYIAAANLTGHWDSAIGNANNDHLLYNGKIDRWQIVVWDLDNSFGSIATGASPWNEAWNAGISEFKHGNDNLVTAAKRPLFHKILKFYQDEYKVRYKEFLTGVFDLIEANKRIVKLRDVFTGGHSDEDKWEILFNWKNHRYAHAVCELDFGKKAKIENLQPVFVDYDNREPKCQ